MENSKDIVLDRWATLFLKGAAIFTALALSWLSWNTIDSYRVIRKTLKYDLRIEEVRGIIIHLDEVLTMSARMAATTGDLQWERRYRSFEGTLDATIKEAMTMVPAAVREETAAKTDAANIALVEMENKSFDLVRLGRLSQAKAVLFSKEYGIQKAVYADGMKKFSDQLNILVKGTMRKEVKKAFIQIGIVAVVVPLLAVAWLVVFSVMRHWRRALLDSNHRFEQQAQELADLNRSLDQRVTERTEELAKAQEKLVQSEKMSAVGQLAAGVAHEVNNPLGIILGYAEGLTRRVKSGDPTEQPLRSIEREALRCKSLVQDLLVFSRADHTERYPMNLNETVQGALALIQPRAKIKGVTVSLSLADGLPLVLGSKNQIQQIIVNLANNALDAMPQDGSLLIQTTLEHQKPLGWVCLKVQDTGKGIPPEILSKIFEPFFTTKPVGQGTGLGLSLVHEIVSRHSGKIDVQSRPGYTEFLVRFPVRDTSKPEEAAQVAARS